MALNCQGSQGSFESWPQRNHHDVPPAIADMIQSTGWSFLRPTKKYMQTNLKFQTELFISHPPNYNRICRIFPPRWLASEPSMTGTGWPPWWPAANVDSAWALPGEDLRGTWWPEVGAPKPMVSLPKIYEVYENPWNMWYESANGRS